MVAFALIFIFLLLVIGAVAVQIGGWFGVVLAFVLVLVLGVASVFVGGMVFRRRLFAELSADAAALEGGTVHLRSVIDLPGPPASALDLDEDDWDPEIESEAEARSELQRELDQMRWVEVELEVVPPPPTGDGPPRAWHPDALGLLSGDAAPSADFYRDAGAVVYVDDVRLVGETAASARDDDDLYSVTGTQRVVLTAGLPRGERRFRVTYHFAGDLGTIDLRPTADGADGADRADGADDV